MTDTDVTPSIWSVQPSQHEYRSGSYSYRSGSYANDWLTRVADVAPMRMVFHSPHHGSTARSVPALPAWTESFTRRLEELAQGGVFEPNWNGHGARAVHVAAVRLAVRVMIALVENEGAMPEITPTFRGGLQLDWHVGGASIEVDVDPNGSVEVFYEDPVEGKDWDAPLSRCESDVRDALRSLAARSPLPADR